MVKNLAAGAGDTGSIPGLGISQKLRGKWALEPQLVTRGSPRARGPPREKDHSEASKPRN